MQKRFLFLIMAAFLLFGLTAYRFSSASAASNNTEPAARIEKVDLSSSLQVDHLDQVIHFPDPKFEQAVRIAIGKPVGAIMKSDVAEVTELSVADSEIINLSGIEHFIALERLDCSRNTLNSLNVSKNVALKWLDCRRSNITSLDVSNNTILRFLFYDGNNLADQSAVIGLDEAGMQLRRWYDEQDAE